jgi:hypothetical protein
MSATETEQAGLQTAVANAPRNWDFAGKNNHGD